MKAPAGPPTHEVLEPLEMRRPVRKAVILAAGRGRRMGRLTADRPKAALEVAGHALLDWQIAALRRAGIDQIAVITGHGAAALAGRDVEGIHNPNWASGTQVESLLQAATWIADNPVIVSYSDILYHPSAALALLDRPGDIVIAYDADHRWLWKRRFGDWLKDSETFRLAAGQVLEEIGGRPTDIETVDGQFMGLMLVTPDGLAALQSTQAALDTNDRRRSDFTRLLARMLAAGYRIDTAANLMPWMEIDSPRDLVIARRMAAADDTDGSPPDLVFPDGSIPGKRDNAAPAAAAIRASPAPDLIRRKQITNAFAIQNWGRSGSTFLQSLFDDHPQVLSTPNFYSRAYYTAWARSLCLVADQDKIDAFLAAFPQWWDTGFVDATAGLHRLGPEQNALAGVDRGRLESHLRSAFADGRPITRRSLFEAAHLAYALSRGQVIEAECQVLFPVHGRSRNVACAFLEDFPQARFIHTVRDPMANVASSIRHTVRNRLDWREGAVESVLNPLLLGRTVGKVSATAFGDRAYLRHLAARDRARFLRLEDLHRDGPAVLRAACRWLDLDYADSLLLSTFDGRKWWNRPESGQDSRLGSAPDRVDQGPDLSQAEQRLRGLVSRCLVSRDLYARPEPSCGAIAGLQALLQPWPTVGALGVWRRLAALAPLRPWLPPFVARRLQRAMTAEAARARLLAMNLGLVTARRRLEAQRRSAPLDAVLWLRRTKTAWRTRILLRPSPGALTEGADRLEVGVLEDPAAPATAADHLILGSMLWAGALAAHISAGLRHRKLALLVVMQKPSQMKSRLQLISGPKPSERPK